MDDLISRAAVLDAIEALQHSPWYGDEKDTAYHHRYLTRKEAVEIVRDLAVKSVPAVDAVPVEWLEDRVYDMKRAPLYRRYAEMLVMEWLQEQKEQEAR